MARTHKAKGISLAKGPVGLIGLALLAYGITALIFGGHGFAQHAPNGTVHGKTWLGLEVNGWSGLLFVAAGLLLLLGAPLHWAAKGFSLIVGLGLGTAALIALADSHGAVGLFAANHLTELVWGAAAVVLIGFSLLPRVGGKSVRPDDHGRTERVRAARGAEPESERADPEPPPRSVEREPAHRRTARVQHRGQHAHGAGTRTGVMTPAAETTLDLPQRSAPAPAAGTVTGTRAMTPASETTPEPDTAINSN